jgi:hypothetical protein
MMSLFFRFKCSVCGQKIRRLDSSKAVFWITPRGLGVGHPECARAVENDPQWHASDAQKARLRERPFGEVTR